MKSFNFLFCILTISLSLKIYSNENSRLFELSKTTHQLFVQEEKQFKKDVQKLDIDIQKFCKESTNISFDKTKISLKSVISSWSRFNVMGYGPLIQDTLNWSFQFWPDKKGRTIKALAKLLISETPFTRENFNESTPLLQGIPAIEALLFSNRFGNLDFYQKNKNACPVLRAVVTTLQNKVNAFEEKITKWTDEILNKNYVVFFTGTKEVLEEQFKGLVGVLELIKRRKLRDPSGHPTFKRTKKTYVEFRYAHLSYRAISENVKMIKKILTGKENGNSFYNELILIGKISAVNKIEEKIEELLQYLEKEKRSLYSMLGNIEEKEKAFINELYAKTGQLEKLLKFAAYHLKYNLGFNAQDGD